MKHYTLASLLVLQLLLIVLVNGNLQGHCVANSTIASNLTAMCLNALESLSNIDTSVSNQKLLLSSKEYVLERVLHFKTVRNVSIVGHVGGTTIKCSGEDAGLMFVDSQWISLDSVVIVGCGGLFNSTSTNLSDTINVKTLVSRSAMYFEGCTNVALNNVQVQNSPGSGVTMYNTNGLVRFTQSHFKFNGNYEKGLPNSGGVYIEFSRCNPGVLISDCDLTTDNRMNAVFEFHNCHFEFNEARTVNLNKSSFIRLSGNNRSSTNQQTLGRGGGLALYLMGRAKNISVDIMDCIFVNNSAISGGGLFMSFEDSASDIRVSIERSNFTENDARYGGGGIAYQIVSNTVRKISVNFRNCTLFENAAENGGGFILSYNNLESSGNMQNSLVVDSLKFVGNLAKYGSAVDALIYAPSGYVGPYPVFKNCYFFSNRVSRTLLVDIDSTLSQSFFGTGTFTISKLPIDFNESVIFEKNIGSSLWAVSSRITFNSPMKAIFVENVGIEGGAMGLVSFSVAYFRDNVEFEFIRNAAYNHGGAIFSFQYGKQQLLGASSQCPLQYIGQSSINNRKVSLYFEDNTLLNVASNESKHGRSIYMTSIQPCVFLCQVNPDADLTLENMFSCIGNVTFNSSNLLISEEISTSGRMFSLVDGYNLTTLSIVPGKVHVLPVTIINDLGDPLPYRSYRARIYNRKSQIDIDPAYQLITQRSLKVYGPVGAIGTVQFESTGQYHFLLRMPIVLLPCPPGFYSDHLEVFERGIVKSQLSCTCNWNNTSHSVYQGVNCNSAAFEAQVSHIYWIGYVSEYAIPQHLFTSFCPQQFCYSSLKISPLHMLPVKASQEVLNALVCGPNRRGILCGECAEGYTVFYHSVHFKCAHNHLCHVGVLFFLLSEILPLTIMFVVIVLSNVNFSSGALNGFILFAQVLDSLSIGAYGMLEFQLIKSRPFYHITLMYRFIYRVLNLDFFTEDHLAFCLWEGASTLDMLAFKFVVIFYAFLLVLVSILFVNKCKLKWKFCPSLRIATIRSYIIHGLSAFLITCYIKCAQIAFHILIPGRLIGMPLTSNSSLDHNFHLKVVLFSGNIGYLSSAHLPYAFPAILVICLVCLPPPVLLLWYPLGRQALAKVIEKCSKYNYRLRNGGWSCRRVNVVDKLKPLLDSFQSCYKDNCRYFAGLQFVYRLIILCTFNFTETPLIFYTAVGVELSFMLVVHVIFWPYRKRWHNIMDTLIYANIILVNGFTMFIYSSSVNFLSTWVYEAAVVQTLLIYLPLLYIIGYMALMLYRVLKPKVIKKKKRTTTALDDGFPARLIQNSYETSYTLDDM